MFTGLIESTGEVISFATGAGGGTARLTIAAPEIAVRLRTGDSVGVNGVCLTALGIEPNAFPARFSADLAAETIARTTLPDEMELIAAALRRNAANARLTVPTGDSVGVNGVCLTALGIAVHAFPARFSA